MRVHMTRSDDPAKKYMVVVESADRKKTIHFGDAKSKDYTKYSALEREKHKRSYLARHRTTEDWSDPFTAGFWSRWVLWNLPTVEASYKDTLRRFNLSPTAQA